MRTLETEIKEVLDDAFLEGREATTKALLRYLSTLMPYVDETQGYKRGYRDAVRKIKEQIERMMGHE